MDELKELLSKVKDTYDDFEYGVALVCRKTPGLEKDVVKLIKDNPDITTSEVIEFIS